MRRLLNAGAFRGVHVHTYVYAILCVYVSMYVQYVASFYNYVSVSTYVRVCVYT